MKALILLSLAISVATFVPSDAVACGRMGHAGSPPVFVDFEEALLVWDAAHQTEHLIRSASFLGVDRDFGFVVPTPTEPTLTEVDEAVFRVLSFLYNRPEPQATRGAHGGGRSTRGGAGSSVTVVAAQYVAGMDATVLRANDAQGLSRWLRAHHLVTPNGTTAWLAPYVRDGWYLTVFQYSAERGRRDFVNRAVRMSFRTPRPVFPYSEPSGQRQHRGRRFRITVVADSRMDAFLGTEAWSAPVRYAGVAGVYGESVLGPRIPDGAWSTSSWFTTFEERESRRGTQDLVFAAAARNVEVAPSIDLDRNPFTHTVHVRPARVRDTRRDDIAGTIGDL